MRRYAVLPTFSLKCYWHIIAILRSSRPENSQNVQENNSAGVPFETKLQAAGQLKKRLQCFLRTLPEDCSKIKFLHTLIVLYSLNLFTNISAEFVHQDEQQPIYNLCELCMVFLYATKVLLIKLIFYIMNKKAVDLKFSTELAEKLIQQVFKS